MKSKLCFLFLICLSCSRLFAQTSKEIEADLVKSLDEIQKYNYSNFLTPEKSDPDSLFDENERFEKKIIHYAEKYSNNINPVLKDIGGLCSNDGLLDIISWDTFSGGTQHQFQSVVLYRSKKTESFQLDTLSEKELNMAYTNSYDSLYTLTIGNKNYYIVTFYQILDLHGRGEGVGIFSIDNGKLNGKPKIIKTISGLTHKLYIEYNQTETNADIMSDVTIRYDPKEKTITFPVINEKGRKTDNYITYKFTGQYFEREKN